MYIVIDIKPAIPLLVGHSNDAKGAKSLLDVYVDNQQSLAKVSLGANMGEPQKHDMWRDEDDVVVVEVKRKK